MPKQPAVVKRQSGSQSPDEPAPVPLVGEAGFPLHVLRRGDLTLRALSNGCIYSIEHKDILINQLLASPVAGGIHRVYLRVHCSADDIRLIPIVGPLGDSAFAAGPEELEWRNQLGALECLCTCRLHPAGQGWCFRVEVQNHTAAAVRCDAILVQDLGLGTRGHVRNNECFNAQYLDHRAVEHERLGWVVMTRQNQPQGRDQTHPWLIQGCLPRAAGFTTDGFDFFGVESRRDGFPAARTRPIIGRRVRQSEAAYTALQSEAVEVAAGGTGTFTFFAQFVAHHPQPSSQEDLKRLDVDWVNAPIAPAHLVTINSSPSVFHGGMFPADELAAGDLDRLFPGPRRHEESGADGRLLSFFHGDDARHVVLRAKELSVERPHGHILRAGTGLAPDDELMSCTGFAAGVFASQLTLGNTSLAKLLSPARDPLNLVRSSGLRIFVRANASGAWEQLGVPSAFEMAPDRCRWIYTERAQTLTVTAVAADDDPVLTYDVRIDGQPLELLISGEIVAGSDEYNDAPRMSIDPSRGRITVRPDEASLLAKKQPQIVFHIVTATRDALESLGGDELLFTDRSRRGFPYFAMRTSATKRFTFTVLGAISDPQRAEALSAKYESVHHSDQSRFWRDITADVRMSGGSSADAIRDALVWFARDAIVHLGTPRGLEQRNGGAWGVRDVCQGPVEFLLAYDHGPLVADIVRTVFAQQYERRGDWPQWFMFPPFQQIQSNHSHGDVLIWPLKALCDYLEHTNDGAFLDERVPYTDDTTLRPSQRAESILRHVDRLIERMRQQLLAPGLALPRYGDGDWDDSLQPADPLLRERMVSAWTAALIFQTLRRWSEALSHFGHGERADAAMTMARAIEVDFQKHLMPGGVVAGFAVFDGADPPRPVEYLLHPSDTRTGLRYRLIPMTRGILSGIFNADQAKHHLNLIHEHLLFPDGARLMDRPTEYRGGIERTFRRSESAAFFGREIGLQYVHAHLRYAEALAMMGRADELWRALQVVNPITVTDLVPGARARQRNCYFSSSDAAFDDRYQAAREYDKLRRGEVPTDGGWRIYSSGPGIYTSLVVRHLFGIRRYFDCVEFDPVLPRELDGAAVELLKQGRRVRYEFSVEGGRAAAASPHIVVNGIPVASPSPASNPYRRGALRISQAQLESRLTQPLNVVQIAL